MIALCRCIHCSVAHGRFLPPCFLLLLLLVSFSRHQASQTPPFRRRRPSVKPPRPIAAGPNDYSQSEHRIGALPDARRGKKTGKSCSVFAHGTRAHRAASSPAVYTHPCFCLLIKKLVRFHSVSSSSETWFSMSGFDDPGVYYSDSFGGGDGHGGDEGGLKKIQIKKRFREFLRQFRVGTDRTGFTYKYR